MTQKEKRLKRISDCEKEISFKKIKSLLNYKGYELIRTRGSHNIFKNNRNVIINFPVHNNKVKKVYIKQIINIININDGE